MVTMATSQENGEVSTKRTSYPDEGLDPRIQIELEKLNKASDDINRLELQLDEARSSWRQVLNESTQQLNGLSRKLGSCIEKARPYYQSRLTAKEAQQETQAAALRYERACGQLVAAKEMVNLAEQGFFRRSDQPFDPAWQEMLNHATIKVNDAERERYESELEHQRTASIFNEAETQVTRLHRQLRRNITKSRPYFEQKALFNQTMEERKQHVNQLEAAVQAAKTHYSSALRQLEDISDEIHRSRGTGTTRNMGKRGAGVGAESPSPPPGTESSPEEDNITRPTSLIANKVDPPNSEANTQPDPAKQPASQAVNGTDKPVDTQPVSKPSNPGQDKPIEGAIKPSRASYLSVPGMMSTGEVSEEDDDGGSETESVASSWVLDDEQVESMMREEQEVDVNDTSDHWQPERLPAKLDYLAGYINGCEQLTDQPESEDDKTLVYDAESVKVDKRGACDEVPVKTSNGNSKEAQVLSPDSQAIQDLFVTEKTPGQLVAPPPVVDDVVWLMCSPRGKNEGKNDGKKDIKGKREERVDAKNEGMEEELLVTRL